MLVKTLSEMGLDFELEYQLEEIHAAIEAWDKNTKQ